MKRILFAVAVFPLLAFGTTGINNNELGLTIYTQEVATPIEVQQQILAMDGGAYAIDDLGSSLKDINEIINLGEKIWKIIEKNKPVVNVKYAYANAVPKGIKGPEELEGFSPLQFKSFRKFGKNGFGSTVFDVTYTLAHRFNGQYQGRGRFLDAVTVLPHKVEVLWGYTLNFNVARVSTANVGSEKEPVASVAMEMDFQISTILKASQYRNLYEFRGDSKRVTSIEN